MPNGSIGGYQQRYDRQRYDSLGKQTSEEEATDRERRAIGAPEVQSSPPPDNFDRPPLVNLVLQI